MSRTQHEMAQHLATYITCPSTIRVHLISHYGKDRVLPIEKIAELRRQAVEAKAKPFYSYPIKGGETLDHVHFSPRSLVPIKRAKTAALWPVWYRPSHSTPADMMLRRIATDFDCTAENLKSKSRDARFTHPRSLFIRLMRDRKLSYPTIGRLLGNRDHSTIIHSLKMFDIYARKEPRLIEVYNELVQHNA